MKLREQKRLRCEQEIFAAAMELFRMKGFSQTTMQDIPDKAEVAVGTLYNYFDSKGDLLISYLSASSGSIMEKAQVAIEKEHPDPEKAVLELFGIFSELFTSHEKSLWREYLSAAYNDSNKLSGRIWGTQQGFQELLVKLIVDFQKEKIINPNLNPAVAASVLYSSFFLQFLRYINTDLSLSQLLQDLNAQIYVTFQGLNNH